jgi:hypothetical protein
MYVYRVVQNEYPHLSPAFVPQVCGWKLVDMRPETCNIDNSFMLYG